LTTIGVAMRHDRRTLTLTIMLCAVPLPLLAQQPDVPD